MNVYRVVRATLTVAPADVYYVLCLIAFSKHRPVPLLELLELCIGVSNSRTSWTEQL